MESAIPLILGAKTTAFLEPRPTPSLPLASPCPQKRRIPCLRLPGVLLEMNARNDLIGETRSHVTSSAFKHNRVDNFRLVVGNFHIKPTNTPWPSSPMDYQHHIPPPPLSRTSSAMSFSSTSEDDGASMSSSTVTVITASRRTRKRFTNVQLTMLENLFHQNSHPSREDREAVAKAGGM